MYLAQLHSGRCVSIEELLLPTQLLVFNQKQQQVGLRMVCVQDPFLWTGSDVRSREPDLPTIHFAVAFKGASWSDPDSVALMVMQVRPCFQLDWLSGSFVCVGVCVC